ncbi:MAG: hypothetical protein ABFD54_07105 [Armatimonadota bacterium]|nr:hypothetical protein [bacterium]
MDAFQIIVLVISTNLVVWSLVFVRLHRQAGQIIEETQRLGEDLVIPPVKANYQGWTKRFGIAKTMGRIALTNHRIIFKRPFGSDIIIPLKEIVEVSDTVHLGQLSHTFGKYLSIKLQDDTEVVFLVNDQARWIEQIKSRISVS